MTDLKALDTPASASTATDAAAPAPGLLSASYRTVTAGIVSLTSLVAFEALAVATAMPAAAADLDGLQWYALAFAGTLAASVVGIVNAGAWSDSSGPAAPLWSAVAAFVAGLLIAGLAPTMPVLVAGRIVQGLGIGSIAVILYVLAARVYPERLHSRVFAAMSAAWVVPSLIGPAISGVIVDSIGWRWVFLIVPFAAVPAALMLLPAVRRPGSPRSAAATSRGRLAWAALAAMGLCVLHLAGQPGEGVRVLLALPAGLALAAGAARLFPRGTFSLARGLPSLLAVRGLSAAAFFGAEAFMPLMLIEHQGYSTLAAGTTLSAAAIGWSAGAWYQSHSRAQRTPAQYLHAGARLMLAGSLAIALTIGGVLAAAWAAPAWLAVGLGMGLQRPSLGVLLIRLSPRDRIGRNSSALQLSDAIAVAATLAVSGAVYATARDGFVTEAFIAIFCISAALVVAGERAIGRIAC